MRDVRVFDRKRTQRRTFAVYWRTLRDFYVMLRVRNRVGDRLEEGVLPYRVRRSGEGLYGTGGYSGEYRMVWVVSLAVVPVEAEGDADGDGSLSEDTLPDDTFFEIV
ncbi:hypothetical protein BCR33DRAFT_722640 [Rhizoclosmatium globosum]|uniref:Uncharacterized protein n=1 Tax=Rhizoclosmatium globosum TaxID=329046 RepID=A0A1Y2BIA6_9FUNG|nr:hypothetical protein BCR33DRAFT_722640 [Rhizoclosmatium globosum]|eukprot:ORY34524.1 hypothetical protein BCR33DRAFT_722640 [Rhizoclosmatium globosum]